MDAVDTVDVVDAVGVAALSAVTTVAAVPGATADGVDAAAAAIAVEVAVAAATPVTGVNAADTVTVARTWLKRSFARASVSRTRTSFEKRSSTLRIWMRDVVRTPPFLTSPFMTGWRT